MAGPPKDTFMVQTALEKKGGLKNRVALIRKGGKTY